MDRRQFLLGLSASMLTPGIARASTSAVATHVAPRATTLGAPRLIQWDTDTERPIAILVPDGPAHVKYPMVVCLHGMGETRKSPCDGSLGWPRDYALQQAMSRVIHPPLSSDDFEGLITAENLRETNSMLMHQPFQGLVAVCPRIPPFHLSDDGAVDAYGEWLVDTLIPRVQEELPVIADATSTGIDGVSLGGAMAIRIGLSHPETFALVGSLQPAIAKDSGPKLEGWLKEARAYGDVLFRLTTSTDDAYRENLETVHAYLADNGVDHDFSELVGPHDYPFNRGPGSYELLLWHDRYLAR